MGCAISLVPSRKYNLAQLSQKTSRLCEQTSRLCEQTSRLCEQTSRLCEQTSRLCEQTTRQEHLLLTKTGEGADVLKILLSNIVIEAVVK